MKSSINSSLFSTNVGYRKSCCQTFRAPTWKKVKSDKPFTFEKDCIEELVGVIEYLVALKRKIYTLRQLRELYASIKKIYINTIRSIDISRIIEERLSGKVQFCKPKSWNSVWVCIICWWKRFTWYIQRYANQVRNYKLYAIESCCLFNIITIKIESREKTPWSPTPQNILELHELLELDKRLFNLTAWEVSPSAAMGKNGFVQLSERKGTNVSEIVQSWVPGSQPGFN